MNKLFKYFRDDIFSFIFLFIYCIKLRRARFIAGFGQIFWVEPNEMLFADPLSESEDRIVAHMNEDHSDSLIHYCKAIKGLQLSESETVVMSGIDSEGFDMLVASKKVRIVFDAPIKNPKEAREVLVRLAKADP
ncbi:MAG: DUF2470 domain-containing protein [Blastocatellia bacterium]|nr:DUF2470 domain-containing protein [Blastocatellia bacterium]